jgi:hypothetical protein
MAGNRSVRTPCSRRLRWWLARLVTLFGVAIAALASCQSFRDTGQGARASSDEYAQLDDCVEHGGSWSIAAHRCEPAVDAARRE